MDRFSKDSRHAVSVLARILILALVPGVLSLRSDSGHAAEGVGTVLSVDSSNSSPVSVSGLTSGTTYRLIVWGSYTHASASTADAECSAGSRYPRLSSDPLNDLLDLYVDNQALEWTPLSSTDQVMRCAGDTPRTYYLDYSASSASIGFKIKDDDYSDNSGSLSVMVACRVAYPGTLIVQSRTINGGASETASPAPGCPNGQIYTPSSFRAAEDGTEETKSDSYQCGKFRNVGMKDEARTFGYIDSADLLIDSRQNTVDPVSMEEDTQYPKRGYPNPTSGYYSGTPTVEAKWRQSGHRGISTCNWTEPNVTYTVTVKGVFKHDQSVTGTTLDTSAGAINYGWSDAECATGYVESSAPLVNYNGVATGGVAQDQYIPPHINNYLFNGWYAQTATAKTDPAWRDPKKPAPKPAGLYYPSSTAVPFDPYGSQWKPHRFDYKSALNSIPFDAWDLGLEWAGHTKQFEWIPLVHDGANLVEQTSFPSGFSTGCSSEHTYGIRIKGDGRPIYFVLRDLVHYAEWDNCGALSIHVQKSSTGFVEPQTPPSYGCHYVPEGGDGHLVDMDAPTEDRPDAETYFTPERTVINQMKFKISSGTVVSTVQWRNYSRTHHSITAAIDQNGNWCANLSVPDDLEPTPDNPDDDKVPLPLTKGAKDDCTFGSTSTTQAGRRLFECDWDCLQETSGATGYTKRVNEIFTATITASSRCNTSTGYCSIPYYCRYLPYKMRGELVMRIEE